MTTRYTFKQLKQDVAHYNDSLSDINHPYCFGTGRTYGCTQLIHSLMDAPQTHLDTIESGSPKDCLRTMQRTYYYWRSDTFDLNYAREIASRNAESID